MDDRAELIKQLRELADYVEQAPPVQYEQEAAKTMLEAADALEAAPAVPEEWRKALIDAQVSLDPNCETRWCQTYKHLLAAPEASDNDPQLPSRKEWEKSADNLEGRRFLDMTEDDKAACFDMIIELCGHVENGTNQTVKIFQDDATRTWHIAVGHGPDKNSWWGNSLPQLFEVVKEALERGAKDE
jgi:hypothetical protein